MKNTLNIFDQIHISDKDVIDLFISSLKSSKRLFLTYLNQHCFNLYSTNQVYRNLIESKFIVYADGVGINLASKILFKKIYKQFNATDLNERFIKILIDEKNKFFIIGGNFNEDDVRSHFNLNENFVGYHPGYFSDSEIGIISEKICILKPDVVIIGMGVPKQEIIAAKLSKLIDASLFLCVGNFLEFYFGTIRRIPIRFRNKGIEWIYRIFQEPKRLWKRYFIGIPLFIFRVIKYKFLISKIS